MQVCPYLNFDGDCEEAMRFYAAALGGELPEIHRFSNMPSEQPMPPEVGNRVMHVTMNLPGGAVIMASDTFPGSDRVVGTNAAISIHPDSRDEADRIFAALSEGAEVTMPLADQFWGDYFGSLTDKYGVPWMINYNEAGVSG